MLAERHRRSLQHHGRTRQPRGLGDALLWDQTRVGELDLPVVAQARIADEPELLVERAATSRRRRIVQSAARRHQGQPVGVDHPRDPIPRQVWVEGDLVTLDDVLEGDGDLFGAVADWDELLVGGDGALLQADLGTGVHPEMLRAEFGGRFCKKCIFNLDF